MEIVRNLDGGAFYTSGKQSKADELQRQTIAFVCYQSRFQILSNMPIWYSLLRYAARDKVDKLS